MSCLTLLAWSFARRIGETDAFGLPSAQDPAYNSVVAHFLRTTEVGPDFRECPDGDALTSKTKRHKFGQLLVSRHDIAAVWVAFSPSGLHSSQDRSAIHCC